jgi:cation:H+ antiporter
MARGLTRLGTKVGLSEGLLGLLGALGADSPELSSAVIAMLAGAGSVGVGVVVGSNLFNLAALLGLSAVVAGGVRIRRGPLVLDAAVGIIVLIGAAAMVAGLVAPSVTVAVIGVVVVAYVVILSVPRRVLDRLNPLRRSVPEGLVEVAYEATHDRPASTHASWAPVVILPFAVAAVVGGSFAMVHAALDSQPFLHLSNAVLGTIVLAALTSLPNLWVALHFARSERGTALFSSAMNSNSINLVGGLMIPALFVGSSVAAGSLADFAWLGFLTVLSVALPFQQNRISRPAGGVIIAVYMIFVVRTVTGG